MGKSLFSTAHYDTLLFDLDDTLLDFRASERESFTKAAMAMGLTEAQISPDFFAQVSKNLWDRYARGEIGKKDVLVNRFARYCTELNAKADPVAFEEAFETDLSQSAILFPDTVAVLSALKAGGIRSYLITNGLAVTQKRRLSLCGLSPFFADIFISEEVGALKPSYKFFCAVEAQIPGFAKDKTLVLGDSLVSDIPLATANGMAACWVNRFHEKNEGNVPFHYEIDSLQPLLALIGSSREAREP